MTDQLRRLDHRLLERDLVTSRTRAEAIIKEGGVTVNGSVVVRPGKKFAEQDHIELIKEPMPWVSRGALKLVGALDAWNIDVTNHHCLDVGASTGGFTEVLLSRGATHVVAVDTGTAQLAASLIQDGRVLNLEKTNIKAVTEEQLEHPIETAVVDVSFVSLSQILPEIDRLTASPLSLIALVKPQFEVGRELVGKNGIVRKEAARQSALKKVIKLAKELGFTLNGSIDSPIQGGDGNHEYLIYLQK